jgi:NADPH2:quinone reductase
MEMVDRDPGRPGAGQIRMRQTAVGVNFVDVHHRRGTYPMDMPLTPGYEAAGVVEEVGEGVTGLRAGDRVAYAAAPLIPAAYTEARLLPADRAVRLPDGVSDLDAAALLFKGMTVQALVRSAYPVRRGDTVLVHAAAGGLGSLLCRWAHHLGATVIGTVRSDAKAAQAKENGCHHVIVTSNEDFPSRVRELTGGEGVHASYDNVGRDTLLGSLDCVRSFGTLISLGQSSGPIPPLDISLMGHESIYCQKFSVKVYMRHAGPYQAMAAETLRAIEDGIIPRRYTVRQFGDVQQVHAELESGTTTGIFVLKV